MNEEFAVEPTAFENFLQLKYVLEKFGFHRGRFIVGFPSRWIRQVHEQSLLFSEIEQAKARILLIKAKKSVVNTGDLGFEPSLPWLDNVHRFSTTNSPFYGVIAANANSFNYPTVHDIDDDFFGASNDVRIEGTAENYSRIARRLLQMSYEVAFVDHCLRLERPACEKVVKSFLAIAQEGKCKHFVFWAREKLAAKAYRRMLEEKYKSSLAPKSTLTVNLVNDDGSPEKMHARLLLSNLGGLRFDHGFEEFDDGRRVYVSLVSEQSNDSDYSWYLDPNSQNDFEIVEKHCISG